MSFFYNLNKTLDSIREKPELTHKQLNERNMSRAAKGYEKYGKEGMEALAKAGREGKALDPVRNKYDKYDKEVDEGAYQGGPDKSQIPAVNRPGNKMTLQDLEKERNQSPTTPDGMRALQNKLKNIYPMDEAEMEEGNAFSKAVVDAKADGIQPGEKIRVGGKEYPVKEAAKYRDAKYKDKLYTQEPRDYDQYDYGDSDYYNPKPADYPGAKRKIGGGEFDHNDPLRRGDGIGRSGIKNNINLSGKRKGLPSRDQITSLKSSIKSASGTHAEPNLPEAGTPMTAKQKSFADKIAGAKKEVDEMLGDVAAEAMRSALSPKQKKLDKNDNGKLDAQDFAMLRKGGKQKTTEDDKEDLNPFTNYKKPRQDTPRVGDTEHGSKHDIKHTSTGRMVTRRADAQGMSIGSDTDDEGNKHEKRGRGRPTGPAKAPERVTAKATKHKDGRKVKEGDFGPMEEGSGDLKAAMALLKKAGYKISKAVEEEKTTTRDDHAEKAGKRVAKDIEYDEKKKDGIHGKKRDSEDDKAEKAGKKVAKDIEYDEKKDKKEDKPKKVKEAGGTDTPTASSGFSYGQGIYDSINHEIEKMIAESMSMNMSDSTDGTKSLTITATDEDAVKLSMLLNTAGIGGGNDSEGYGGSGYKSACGCGTPDCSCGDQEMEMDEAAPTVSDNEPDYPTNTEEGNAFQYSGGLDGPKSTGQSTVPVLASQDDRQHSYAEDDALRRMMEMAGIKEVAKDAVKEKCPPMSHVEKMCKDGKSVAEICKMHPNCDQKELRKMIADCKEKMDEASMHMTTVNGKKVEESIFTLTNQWKAYKG